MQPYNLVFATALPDTQTGAGEKDPPKSFHVFRLTTKVDNTSTSLSIVGPLVIRNFVCLPFAFDVTTLITQNKV